MQLHINFCTYFNISYNWFWIIWLFYLIQSVCYACVNFKFSSANKENILSRFECTSFSLRIRKYLVNCFCSVLWCLSSKGFGIIQVYRQTGSSPFESYINMGHLEFEYCMCLSRYINVHPLHRCGCSQVFWPAWSL